jgi:hypothetical protein
MPGLSVPANITGTTDVGFEAFNLVLESVRAAAFCGFPLGGSLDTGHPAGAGYSRVVNGVPWMLPDAASAGGVFAARVFAICENAATTITPKIRNVTDSSDAVVGSACSGTSANWSGTGQNQSLAFTPATTKIYELHAAKSADNHQCWIIGYLQRTEA